MTTNMRTNQKKMFGNAENTQKIRHIFVLKMQFTVLNCHTVSGNGNNKIQPTGNT